MYALLPTPNSGPSTVVSRSKEKKRILDKYVSKFGSGLAIKNQSSPRKKVSITIKKFPLLTILLAPHEAIHQHVLPSEGIGSIQHHHNSYQGICGLLQEQVVKHPPVEYQLRGDDTQALTMASDRLFFATRAGIELRKSNKDQSTLS
jgi:hypothetical protein